MEYSKGNPGSATLPFIELNDHCTTSIVLVHGAFASGEEEWSTVAPLLEDFHLIIPDLTGHGHARQLYPEASVETSARLISLLIQSRTKQGKAYVVGFSYGSHIVVELLSKHPGCVDVAMITGYNTLPIHPAVIAYPLWLSSRLSHFFQSPPANPKTDAVDEQDTSRGQSLGMYKAIAQTICTATYPRPWKARTLIVAAGKTGFLIIPDRAESALTLGRIAREGNRESLAVTNPECLHAWHRETPQLFASTVRQWSRHKSLDVGFQELSL